MRWIPIIGLMTAGGLLAACEPVEELSDFAINVLPPPDVNSDAKLTFERRDWAGSLTVTNEGSSWDVAVNTGTDRVEISVRSGTGSNLSGLKGVTATRVSLLEDAITRELSFYVGDESGPRYLLEAVEPTSLTNETFGGGFVRPAEDLGIATIAGTTLNLTSVTVNTEEGPVEAFPGDPIEIKFNDFSYRFTLLGSWTRDVPSNLVRDCDLDTYLAYEVVRVEPGTGDDDPIERNPEVEIDGGDCTVGGVPGL